MVRTTKHDTKNSLSWASFFHLHSMTLDCVESFMLWVILTGPGRNFGVWIADFTGSGLGNSHIFPFTNIFRYEGKLSFCSREEAFLRQNLSCTRWSLLFFFKSTTCWGVKWILKTLVCSDPTALLFTVMGEGSNKMNMVSKNGRLLKWISGWAVVKGFIAQFEDWSYLK